MIEIQDNWSKVERVSFVFSLNKYFLSKFIYGLIDPPLTLVLILISQIQWWAFYMFDEMFVSCLRISPKPNSSKFQVHFSFLFLLSFFQPTMFEFVCVFLRIEKSMVLNFAWSFIFIFISLQLCCSSIIEEANLCESVSVEIIHDNCMY